MINRTFSLGIRSFNCVEKTSFRPCMSAGKTSLRRPLGWNFTGREAWCFGSPPRTRNLLRSKKHPDESRMTKPNPRVILLSRVGFKQKPRSPVVNQYSTRGFLTYWHTAGFSPAPERFTWPSAIVFAYTLEFSSSSSSSSGHLSLLPLPLIAISCKNETLMISCE